MAKQKVIELRGDHPFLNFYRAPFKMMHPVAYWPCTYDTVEHAFQAHKGLYVVSGDPGVAHDWVMEVLTPREAKARGRELKIHAARWDRDSFWRMVSFQAAKFQQNKKLRAQLRKTGSAILVEDRPDPIWGVGRDGEGQNLCGKSLMVVRDIILNID